MGCGCKGGQVENNKSSQELGEEKANGVTFSNSLFMRLFLFLIGFIVVLLTLVPIIIPMLAIMLFNRIVLNKSTDVTKPLIKVGKVMSKRKQNREDNNDDDYENEEEINPEDYELEDVEVVD